MLALPDSLAVTTDRKGKNMRYRIEYKGELIVAGSSVGWGWAFWTGIKPDPEFDLTTVVEKLDAIRRNFGIRYEFYNGRFGFPPAFTAIAEDTLGVEQS
jgi:hypothetical protein